MPQTVTSPRPARCADLRVREIASIQELEALRPRWNALLEDCEHPVLYLTSEWLSTWWRCHQTRRRKLCLLVVIERDELIGIAPLMETRCFFFGLPLKKIEFLSMMRYALSPGNLSATLDIIVKAGRHGDVIRAVMDFLSEKKSGWNFMRLHPVPSTSSNLEPLRQEAARLGYRFRKRIVFANSVLPFDTTWDAYWAGKRKNLRKKINGYEKQLQKAGALELVEISRLGQLQNGFESLMAIERRSWKWGHGLHLDAPVYRHFYRRFLEVAGENHWLKIWILKVAGREIAYDLTVEYRDSVEGLKTSYDKEFARHSPGTVLTYHKLERLFRSRFSKINFLWGDLEAKAKWTSQSEPHDEVFIYRGDALSRALDILQHRLRLYRISRNLYNRMQRWYWKLGS